MEKEKRPICLHFHIFKNAGTTIEWILEKNFPKHAVRLDPKDPKGILSMQLVQDYLNKNKSIKAVSSHQIRYPILQTNEYLFLPIIFIRNPIDRAISVYKFNRRRKDVITEGIKMAKKLNLSDYIKWHFNQKRNPTIKNYQVFFLSHENNSNPNVDQKDFQKASEIMKNATILGVVDKFDESMVVAEEILKKYFKNIDLSHIQQQITLDRVTNLSERITNGKSEINEEIWNELLERNRFDAQLYLDANKELDIRTKKIKDFHSKLENFKRRCSSIPKNYDIGDFETRIRF